MGFFVLTGILRVHTLYIWTTKFALEISSFAFGFHKIDSGRVSIYI